MSENAWEKQEQIFHQALTLTGEKRNDYIAQACEGDLKQIAKINRLIDAFETSSDFLSEPVFELGLPLFQKKNPQMENTVIGNFEVRKKIGEGGMGEVYDAVDTRLNRRVALKFLSESFDNDNLAKRQLIREAQAIALLDHPNICSIYGIEQTENHHFIVMQYIEGITLAEFINNSSINQNQILNITRQILSAVAFAHSHGIIHRDLKPTNIMVKNDGQIKILDFGLAKIIEKIPGADPVNENSNSISRNGLIIGTVSYMSPEQLRGEKLDFQSDIFSIGIILYELIFGGNVFLRSSQAETISAILTENPAFPKISKNSVPIGFSKIIRKCLQKEKKNRFQSTSEVLVELDNIKSNQKVNAIFNTKAHLILIVAALLLIITVGLAAISVYQGQIYQGQIYQGQIYQGQASKRSLAMLPITLESVQPEYQYLADGLTRNLIENLSELSQLQVRNESAVSGYKDKPIAPAEAGRELQVDVILTGKLTKRGDSIFLEMKIVNSSDGATLDASEFLIEDSQLSEIQEKVTGKIISKLEFALTEKDKIQLAKDSTQSSDALKLYFKGRFYWSRRQPDDLRQAIGYFTRATDLDPAYAKAWSGLADSYALYSVPGQVGAIPTEEALVKAKAAAKNALQIDNTLCEPYSSLGTIKLRFEWDWQGAEQDFRTALKLDPEYAPAHYGLSNLLLITGRLDEALLEAEKMKEFEPFSISPDLTIGRIYYFKRDYEKAEQIFADLLKKNPDNPRILYLLGLQMLKRGKTKEAVDAFEKVFAGDQLLGSAITGYCYAKRGQGDKARQMLQKLDQIAKEQYVSSQEKAIIYTGLGEINKAYEHFETACQERFPAFPYLISDPLLDEIHSDNRFANLKQCARL